MKVNLIRMQMISICAALLFSCASKTAAIQVTLLAPPASDDRLIGCGSKTNYVFTKIDRPSATSSIAPRDVTEIECADRTSSAHSAVYLDKSKTAIVEAKREGTRVTYREIFKLTGRETSWTYRWINENEAEVFVVAGIREQPSTHSFSCEEYPSFTEGAQVCWGRETDIFRIGRDLKIERLTHLGQPICDLAVPKSGTVIAFRMGEICLRPATDAKLGYLDMSSRKVTLSNLGMPGPVMEWNKSGTALAVIIFNDGAPTSILEPPLITSTVYIVNQPFNDAAATSAMTVSGFSVFHELPIWSHDDKQLLFTEKSDLYIYSPTTKQLAKVELKNYLVESPDFRWMILSDDDSMLALSGASDGIALIDMRQAKVIDVIDARSPLGLFWHSSKKQLVFQANTQQNGSSRSDMFVYNLATKKSLNLTASLPDQQWNSVKWK